MTAFVVRRRIAKFHLFALRSLQTFPAGVLKATIFTVMFYIATAGDLWGISGAPSFHAAQNAIFGLRNF